MEIARAGCVLAGVLLCACAGRGVGPGAKKNGGAIVEGCRQAIDRFLAKDLSAWNGLPASCDLETVAGILKLEPDPVRREVLGEEGHVAQCRMGQVSAYSEPVSVWYREGRIVRINVRYPELPDVSALLNRLGEPDAKLDCYYFSMPKLNKEGEWVYARRGLTLFMSTDRKNVVEIALFPSTTVERYKKELYTVNPPEER